MLQLVAEGGKASLGGIGSYEKYFGEGDVVELRMTMSFIPPGLVRSMQTALNVAHVDLLTPVYTEPGRVVVIRAQKGMPLLLAIAAVFAVIFVGAILLLLSSWALFRKTPAEAIGDFGLGGGMVMLLGLGAVLWLGLGSKRRKPA
jgi:hypothetical protein